MNGMRTVVFVRPIVGIRLTQISVEPGFKLGVVREGHRLSGRRFRPDNRSVLHNGDVDIRTGSKVHTGINGQTREIQIHRTADQRAPCQRYRIAVAGDITAAFEIYTAARPGVTGVHNSVRYIVVGIHAVGSRTSSGIGTYRPASSVAVKAGCITHREVGARRKFRIPIDGIEGFVLCKYRAVVRFGFDILTGHSHLIPAEEFFRFHYRRHNFCITRCHKGCAHFSGRRIREADSHRRIIGKRGVGHCREHLNRRMTLRPMYDKTDLIAFFHLNADIGKRRIDYRSAIRIVIPGSVVGVLAVYRRAATRRPDHFIILHQNKLQRPICRIANLRILPKAHRGLQRSVKLGCVHDRHRGVFRRRRYCTLREPVTTRVGLPEIRQAQLGATPSALAGVEGKVCIDIVLVKPTDRPGAGAQHHGIAVIGKCVLHAHVILQLRQIRDIICRITSRNRSIRDAEGRSRGHIIFRLGAVYLEQEGNILTRLHTYIFDIFRVFAGRQILPDRRSAFFCRLCRIHDLIIDRDGKIHCRILAYGKGCRQIHGSGVGCHPTEAGDGIGVSDNRAGIQIYAAVLPDIGISQGRPARLELGCRDKRPVQNHTKGPVVPEPFSKTPPGITGVLAVVHDDRPVVLHIQLCAEGSEICAVFVCPCRHGRESKYGKRNKHHAQNQEHAENSLAAHTLLFLSLLSGGHSAPLLY